MRPLTPLLAGQASVFTPPRRGSPKGEDEVSSIDNLKIVLCYLINDFIRSKIIVLDKHCPL